MSGNLVDKGRILATLREANPGLADAADHPDTELTRVPAPFLPAGWALARLVRFLPTRPLVLHVMAGPDGAGGLLTGDPDTFNRLVREAGVRIGDAATALALARTYVEATRVQNRRYQVISALVDLPWRPGLEPDEVARRDAALRILGADVAPKARTSPDGVFVADLVVVSGMDLVRALLAVESDGTVAVAHQPIEADLPFTYTV